MLCENEHERKTAHQRLRGSAVHDAQRAALLSHTAAATSISSYAGSERTWRAASLLTWGVMAGAAVLDICWHSSSISAPGRPVTCQLAGRYKAIVIIEGTTLPPSFQDAAAFETELLRDIPHMPKVRSIRRREALRA